MGESMHNGAIRFEQQIPSKIGHGPYPALVLAEDESDMWLATVCFPEPPSPGVTFHFRGQVWQVFWSDACGCRAEPAVM